MTAQDFAQTLVQIKGILNRLNSGKNWGDIWNSIATARDRALTKSLCNDDDFVLERNGYAFLFTFHNRWDVCFLGKPVYWVDPKLYLGLNFELFLNELQHELRGIEIGVGPDKFNQNDSVISDKFQHKIKAAIDTAIKNSGN